MSETPKAAIAFAEYCALGQGRSLRKLAESKQEYSKSIALLMKWSAQHNWQGRVAEYDIAAIEEREAKKQAAIDAMNERHAMIGTTQQKRAIEQIERLIKAEKFGSQASVQLLKLATDLERLARGAPTERTEQTGSIKVQMERNKVLAQLSDEELDQIDQALARAEERLRGSSNA